MNESVRVAVIADLEMLADFATQAVAEQHENRGGYVWSRRETRSRPYLASFETAFHDPDQTIWIGMIDEKEVAGIIGTELVPSSILCVGYPIKRKYPKPRRNLSELIHVLE